MSKKEWRTYLPVAAAGSLLFLVAGASVVVASRRRRKATISSASALSLPSAVSDLQIEPTTSPEALRAAALERAAKDPATAALVVRFWLGTREGQDGRSLP
jgi:hypothetical protein